MKKNLFSDVTEFLFKIYLQIGQIGHFTLISLKIGCIGKYSPPPQKKIFFEDPVSLRTTDE